MVELHRACHHARCPAVNDAHGWLVRRLFQRGCVTWSEAAEGVSSGAGDQSLAGLAARESHGPGPETVTTACTRIRHPLPTIRPPPGSRETGLKTETAAVPHTVSPQRLTHNTPPSAAPYRGSARKLLAQQLLEAGDRTTATRVALSGIADDLELGEIAARLAPLHPKNNTFPAQVLLELAADAIDESGASRQHPVRRHPQAPPSRRPGPHTNAQHHKAEDAVRAGAMFRAGVDPGLRRRGRLVGHR